MAGQHPTFPKLKIKLGGKVFNEAGQQLATWLSQHLPSVPVHSSVGTTPLTSCTLHKAWGCVRAVVIS